MLAAPALVDVVLDQRSAEWILGQILDEEVGYPLVTTDRRLAGADAPCEVRVPPDVPGSIPPSREG